MPQTYLGLIFDGQSRHFYLALAIIAVLRTLVVPYLLTYLLVQASIWVSQRYQVLARPTQRGSHTIPTPRLGGLGFGAAFYVTAVMLPLWAHIPSSPWYTTLLVGGAWALIGGALDDVLELSPRWKLLLQLAAAGSAIVLGFKLGSLTVPIFGSADIPSMLGSVMAFLLIMLMMNVINFMDGMDGQSAVFGAICAVTLGGYMINFGPAVRQIEAASAATLTGCLCAFLLYNYPGRPVSRKTFMGDSGSQFVGYVLAVLAIRATEANVEDEAVSRFPLVASFILFSPFIYDVVYTIIRRIKRGEDLTQAHRTHLYQRLLVAGWSHGRALALNTILWISAAVISVVYASAAREGAGLVQILSLATTAGLLASYTYVVKMIEETEAQQRKARAM